MHASLNFADFPCFMMDKTFEASARAADCAESKKVPKWADNFDLKRCGCYYEGLVNDYDLHGAISALCGICGYIAMEFENPRKNTRQ